jgi:hypothetical protein
MTGPRPIILEGPAEQDNSSDRARHENRRLLQNTVIH